MGHLEACAAAAGLISLACMSLGAYAVALNAQLNRLGIRTRDLSQPLIEKVERASLLYCAIIVI